MNPTRNANARERLPRWLVRVATTRPRLTLLLWAIVCAIAAPALLRIQIEASTESVLDKASDRWGFYQRSTELFGGDEIIVVATERGNGPTTANLERIRELSREMESLEGVRRVDSLSTFPIVTVDDEGTINLNPAIASTGDLSATAPESATLLALTDRIIPDTLLSSDGQVLAINLVLQQNPAPYYGQILEAVRSIQSSRFEPTDRMWISGVPVFQHETSLQTRRELMIFAPIAAASILLLISSIFRSVRAGGLVIGIGAAGNWLMLAAIGLSGTPIAFTMVILPPLILALAAAYSMHFLAAAARATHNEDTASNDHVSVSLELERVATPVALSGLTTAIGFAATSLAGIEAVRNVGSFGGVGVLATTALVLTALPAALRLSGSHARSPIGLNMLSRWLPEKIAEHCSRRRSPILLVWLGFTLAAAIGVASVDLNTDATRWFRRGTDTRDSYETIRTKLSGISPINVVIESTEPNGSLLTPDTVRRLDELRSYLEDLPSVGRAISVADPILQLHAGFADADSALPESSEALEQYLLLLESAEHIHDLITPDRAATNVVIRLNNNGSADILRTAHMAETWWRERGTEGSTVQATGVMFEFARAQDAIARGQVVGLSAALAAIVALLLATFGSPRSAAATLAPNLAPILGIYGVMGFSNVPVDAGTVLVGSLALGIAVDDTVHVASAYFEARRYSPPVDAIRASLQRTMPAIAYTTVAVGIGFSLLALSDFTFIRNLGLLMAAAMAACFVADSHLLPCLLCVADRGNRDSS